VIHSGIVIGTGCVLRPTEPRQESGVCSSRAPATGQWKAVIGCVVPTRRTVRPSRTPLSADGAVASLNASPPGWAGAHTVTWLTRLSSAESAPSDPLMAAAPSRRTRPLPADWKTRRLACLERDHHQCQIRYRDICTGVASEVDHIRPASQGGTDSLTNLQASCPPCHARKTAGEAAAARQAKYQRNRKPEPHPGTPPTQRSNPARRGPVPHVEATPGG